ncbi:MAG: maleylpyruvate isomerase family mycothiol-dependent enzyme [Streptosporangiaceae bacterium]
MGSDARASIAALRHSHDRLTGLVQPLTPDEVSAQSYCSDWTVAQVLSHLGSGAEISLLMLRAALGEGEPAGQEAFQAIWDVWNAKSPDEQAADAVAADEQHVRTLEQLTDEQLDRARMSFIGMELDAAGIVKLRLGEHALHTWDVAVMQDPAATVSPDAVALLVDNVPGFLAPRLGKPLGEPFSVRIRTTDPERDYLLTSAEGVAVIDWPGEQPAADVAGTRVTEVSMPAEALLRLAYGRLDPEHTPESVSGDPADLDRLRKIFPGF